MDYIRSGEEYSQCEYCSHYFSSSVVCAVDSSGLPPHPLPEDGDLSFPWCYCIFSRLCVCDTKFLSDYLGSAELLSWVSTYFNMTSDA